MAKYLALSFCMAFLFCQLKGSLPLAGTTLLFFAGPTLPPFDTSSSFYWAGFSQEPESDLFDESVRQLFIDDESADGSASTSSLLSNSGISGAFEGPVPESFCRTE